MDLITLVVLFIVPVLLIVTMALALISEALDPLKYSNHYAQWGAKSTGDYYKNPLCKINSKYFYYRPKGWVIVSKNQWEDIEKNIGIKINEAKQVGKETGHKTAIAEIQAMVREERAKITPSSPYELLGVEPTTPMDEIEEKYKYLLQIYSPSIFVGLDEAFTELANIRTEQIKKAWRQVNCGVGISDGTF